MGSRPVGLTSPVRILAIAAPPRMPGYQVSMTAPTLSIHGMVTGPPVSRTTTVCGLAAETVSISLSCSGARARVRRSKPSDSHWYAKTIATSALLAAAAAAGRSSPES